MPSSEHAAEMTRATSRTPTRRPSAGRTPSRWPPTIAEIVTLIEALIATGHAYESGGDVYFRVRSFADYGKLSNRDPEEMDQGEEAGTAQLKEDPLDFALWKARKPDEDAAWPSPWGEGQPGWHIECSAMAEKLLGADFEIHGGGSDLVFPHHENEIAQTESARGLPWPGSGCTTGWCSPAQRRRWRSRSATFSMLGEAIDRFGREAVIAFLISGHYRQPLAFGEDALEQAQARTSACATSSRCRPSRRAEDPVVPRLARRSSPRSPTTSTPRGRWPRCTSWSPRVIGARSRAPTRRSRSCSRSSGSSRWRVRRRRSTPRRRSCSPSASGREPSATSSAPTGSATSSTSVGGGTRHERRGEAGAQAVRGEIVYGRRPVAEAKRGRRRVRRVWTTADVETDELTRLAGSPDHQGFVAEVDPYPYADPEGCSRRPTGCWWPGPGAGSAQPRRGLPLCRGGRGDRPGDPRAAPSAMITPAACKASPARWSTCGWRA